MKYVGILLACLFLLLAALWLQLGYAQSPGFQGPPLFSFDCAHSPQFGRALVCWDTTLNTWFYWNPTTKAYVQSTTTGIIGNTLSAHNFANSISNTGAISGAQPACSDLTGAAASCGTN